MEIFASEDQQVEAIKRWWKENGKFIMVGALLGFIFLGGWNYWNNHKQKEGEQASSLYQVMMEALDENKPDQVIAAAERLKDEYNNTPYAALAALTLARVYVERQALEQALTQLEYAQSQTKESAISHAANLRAARVLVALDRKEQALAKVQNKEVGAYLGAYQESKGDILVAMDRLNEARAAYQIAISAMAEDQGANLVKMKLAELPIVSSDIKGEK